MNKAHNEDAKTVPFAVAMWRNLKGRLAVRWASTRNAAQSLLSLVRGSPHVAIVPLLAFVVLAAVGTWAVCHVAAMEADDVEDHALAIARSTAVQFAAQLLAVFSPVEVLSQVVTAEPEYNTVRHVYNVLAPALLASAPALSAILLAPIGFIQFVVPEQASYLRNNNAFDDRDPEAAAAARKAVQEPGIAIAGPLPPLYGSKGGRVLVVRRSIFVPASGPNETFGRPNATNPWCGSLCDWNATTGMAFWGFAAGFVDMDSFLDPSNPNMALSNPLSTLDELGFSYTLVTADGVTVASSARAPRVAAQAEVVLPGTQWTLLVGQQGQWAPSWLPGAIVAVIAAAALAAIVLFAMLASRRRNQLLLEALLPREMITGLHKQHAAAHLGPRSQCMGSPSEMLHQLLEGLLCGEAPDLRDVVLLRSLLMQGVPWYAPVNASQQIKNANLDSDVERALMRQLGSGSHDATADVCKVFDGPAADILQGGPKAAHGTSADHELAGRAMQLQQFTPTWGSADDDNLFPDAHGPIKLPHQVSDLELHQPQDQGHLLRGVTEDQRCATLRGALAMIVAPHANTQPMRGAASSPGSAAAGAAAGSGGTSGPGSPFPLASAPSRTNMDLLTLSVATLDVELKAQEQEERGGMDLLGTARYATGPGAGIGAGDRLSGGAQRLRPVVATRVAPQALSPLSKAQTLEPSHMQQPQQQQQGDSPSRGFMPRMVSSMKGSARGPSGGGMAPAASPAAAAEQGAASPVTPPIASCPATHTNKLFGMIVPPWSRPGGGVLTASQVKLAEGQGGISGAAAAVTPAAAEEAFEGGPRVSRIGSVGALRRVAELEAPAQAAAGTALRTPGPASTGLGSPQLHLLSTEHDDSRVRLNSIRLVLTPGGRPALGSEWQQQQHQRGSGGSPRESSRSGWLMRSTPAASLWAHGSPSASKRSGSPGPVRAADDALAPVAASVEAAVETDVGGGARTSGDGGALLMPQRMRRVGSYESLVGKGVREAGLEARAGRGSGAGAQPGAGAGADGASGDRGAVGRKRNAEPVGEGEELVASLGAAPRTPEAPMLDEVERLLCHVDGTQYDTWALDAATGGHALSAMGFFLLQREGLVVHLAIPPARLVRLLHALEAGYPANPYHNQVHAADVLRSLHVLLRAARLNTHYVDRLGLLAAYFAAMIHDHGHPGLTGDFLVATLHPLALRYNDRSPLESHHAASAFELLAARPDLDITEGMGREQKAAFRKQVIDMVLATDMKQHFALQGQFTAVAHRRGSAAEGSRGGPSGSAMAAVAAATAVTDSSGGTGGAAAAAPLSPGAARTLAPLHKGGTVGTAGVRTTVTSGGHAAHSGGSNALTNSGGNAAGHSGMLPTVPAAAAAAPQPLDEAERMLSLQIALKVADIGHLAGVLDVHKRWLGVLEEEFFRQGDQERALGLPISPLFDRAKQGVSKSQVGFFDFVALPLVRAFASAFPGAQQLAACFEANYNHWVELQQQQQQK